MTSLMYSVTLGLVLFVLSDVSSSSKVLLRSRSLRTRRDVSVDQLIDLCKFSCPNGRPPIHNPGHTPGSNGCGSYGVNVDLKRCPYLTQCCNGHDVCYDVCGTSRDSCDDTFRTCTQQAPGLPDADTTFFCRNAGMAMYYVVRAAGCSAFKNAQGNACLCPP